MARRFDFEKQQLWLGRVLRWQRSNLTIREFCARLRLSEPSFYAWKRVLAERGLLPSDDGAARANAAHRHGAQATPLFVAATLGESRGDADAASSPLEIVLPDGVAVRVGAGFDAATLRRLLALLRGQSC